MEVGIGHCNTPNAYESGRTVAGLATQSSQIERPELALAFCHGHLSHVEFLRGIRDVVGDIPVIGGSAIGIITNQDLSYEGSPSGVILFQFDEIKFQVSSAADLDRDAILAGQNLAKRFSTSVEDRLLLMFYDSIKVPASPTSPPTMNASPPLIAGIESILPPTLPIVGAGVIGNYQFTPTEQFIGSAVATQSVVGALLSGPAEVYTSVMHGCSPIDGTYRKITRKEDSVIYELDGRPIVETIDELYGHQLWREQFPLKLLTIGVNLGERLRSDENQYVNRLITGILPDGSGIGLFEPDLEVGEEVQLMLRDGNLMITSARNNSERLMDQIIADGKKPVFGLYINCAGRAADYSNTETEEAAEIQQTMNRYKTPLLGFYSGVEVAPILGKNRGLDWTGVLMVLAKDK